MKKLVRHIVIVVCIALLSACGGSPQSPPTGSVIKAVIKPTSLTAGQNVAGIEMAITLPIGVAPPLKADGTADPAATVEITSSAAANQTLPGATYTPATAAAPGQLAISAIVAAGFTSTDQITIHHLKQLYSKVYRNAHAWLGNRQEFALDGIRWLNHSKLERQHTFQVFQQYPVSNHDIRYHRTFYQEREQYPSSIPFYPSVNQQDPSR